VANIGAGGGGGGGGGGGHAYPVYLLRGPVVDRLEVNVQDKSTKFFSNIQLDFQDGGMLGWGDVNVFPYYINILNSNANIFILAISIQT
jgi:hypothetical protein